MFLSSIVPAKIVAAAVTVGGAAIAAAYVGALQSVAHSALGAPAPDDGTNQESTTDEPRLAESVSPTDTPRANDRQSPSTTASPKGPDAAGPAAYGLCNAYAHGGLATTSVAYQSLVTTSGGAASIETYCLTVVKPACPPTNPPPRRPRTTAPASRVPSRSGPERSDRPLTSRH